MSETISRTVYALECPVTDNFIYVGQTYTYALQNRLYSHISSARNYRNHNVELEKYIRILLDKDVKPNMILLQTIISDKKLCKHLSSLAERKWIIYLKNEEYTLFNIITNSLTIYGNDIDTILLDKQTEIQAAINQILLLPNGVNHGKVNRTMVRDKLKYNNRSYKLIQVYCDIKGY